MPTTQTRSVEWLLASCMLAWGFGLLMPGNTMEIEHYRYLAKLADEAVWAIFSISIGGVRIVALYINGSYFRTPLIRTICSGLGIIWWLVLGFLFVIGSDGRPVPALIMCFPVFVGFEGYSVYRASRDSYFTGALRPWRRPIQTLR